MSISMSEAAAKRIHMFFTNRGRGYGVRLGVRISGCAGMTYVLEFVDVLNEYDVIFEDKGVKLIVDSKILGYLNGTQVDFVQDGLKEGFKFHNPNIISECGCGASFKV
ncbi:iron-sulfur cluster assembly protein IscA [Candidatus Profftia tarda]|uniref:Iron-binding protein IscA n=1 Tax=Candidatus Profftia tarda TaxID=1177216 RepID=A0A8E4EYW5_9ENTR|nr:iron-sulfur cluster assembly protein IscA [Candidatus Profftia tarda]CAD6513104.1 Iron-binding protein IscA [Candidatus Profftia tarda]